MTLEEIYEQHADFVWRTLRRMGVPEDDVADAVQSVFLAVHRGLDKFEGRSSVTTWLFAVCRGVARERRRRTERRREVLDEVLVDSEIDLRADVGSQAESRHLATVLASILESLDVAQRNVFVLFELEGMTGDEVAGALSIPVGTVYSRLWAARKAFRQAVSRYEARDRRSVSWPQVVGPEGAKS
jgi:RNA polymerase sigma-70 factor (ECF subfamily)